jgi:UDP-N-acetyl-D-mannosaminuronic acid dehydrogenase
MICVPTPLGPNHVPDISYVERAAESICGVVREGNLVFLESTSPPGTTERVAEIIAAATESASSLYERPDMPAFRASPSRRAARENVS